MQVPLGYYLLLESLALPGIPKKVLLLLHSFMTSQRKILELKEQAPCLILAYISRLSSMWEE